MENQHSTQSELRHSFVPSFASIAREDRMMSPAGNSVHPSPVHPQYLQQAPRQQQQQQQQQQQNSSPGTPQHHSASSSPYHPSFPMNRMNTPDHPNAASYPHAMPPSRNSSHPAPAPSSAGYLDPAAYLNMGDVMGMGMEPLPMGGTMGNNMDMHDLSILSAEEHGDLRILEERERARRMQAHQPGQSMSSSSSHPDGSSGEPKGRGAGRGGRKRADSDDSGHDPMPVARGGPNSSNRKQRGRPRLDTKDENAADRRRTQIRLAQRAYRLRKETTISSLRNRVNELETAIDGMQTTFLELHDSAMSCLSKNPEIAAVGFGSNLKDLTEKFLGLAKGALGSSEGAESGDEDAEGESINEEENGNARSKRRRSRDDGSPGSGGMQGGGGGGSVPSYGGYQVSYSRENGNGRGSRSSYDNSGNQNRSAGGGGGGGSGRNNTMTTNSPLSSNFQNREQDLYSSSASSGGLFPGPPPMFPSASVQYKQQIPTGLDAFSYSFHETNFSRRLHRAGLEYAHLMLTSPDADQYEVARLFAYTFCYISKEDALKTVSRLLQTNSRESLDILEYPELLQLPRKPVDYAEMMQKYEDDSASKAATAAGEKDAFDMKKEAGKMLIKLGIHQKYLRPDEVEQYIKDLGILTSTDTTTVDPDLMDIEVEEPRRSSLRKLQTVSPPVMAPRSPPATPVRNSPSSTQTTNHSQQGGLTSATVMSFEYQPPAVATEDQIRYQLMHFEEDHTPPATLDELDTESSVRVLEGVKKYVDLDMFVKQLIPRGVCLGRFPGFKKSDVEAAISLATTQVY